MLSGLLKVLKPYYSALVGVADLARSTGGQQLRSLLGPRFSSPKRTCGLADFFENDMWQLYTINDPMFEHLISHNWYQKWHFKRSPLEIIRSIFNTSKKFWHFISPKRWSIWDPFGRGFGTWARWPARSPRWRKQRGSMVFLIIEIHSKTTNVLRMDGFFKSIERLTCFVYLFFPLSGYKWRDVNNGQFQVLLRIFETTFWSPDAW